MLATLDPNDPGVGVVTFEVSADRVRTFTDARRSGDARWADQDVHLGKPVSEFLGPGLDEFTLSVRLDLDRGLVPRDELRKFRIIRDQGFVLSFVIGDDVVGDYTLRGLSEDLRRFDARGVLTTAIVELKLREHVK